MRVYIVMAHEPIEGTACFGQYVHAVFMTRQSADSDARRYNETHEAMGSDMRAYVYPEDVRP